MSNNLEKRILDKIKKEKIKPIPKWVFVLKNSLFLSIFGISIFIGALSFSIIFYIFSDNYIYVFQKYNFDKLKFAIFFWLTILILFLYLAIKNYRKTQNSYRYSLLTILNLNIFISFVFGILLYFFGIAQKADEFSTKHLDFYQKNVRITEIKKEIFLRKLKEIGVTKELIKKYPLLKDKVEQKFNETVLDKNIYDRKKDCTLNTFTCNTNEVKFKDSSGCGCKKFYK